VCLYIDQIHLSALVQQYDSDYENVMKSACRLKLNIRKVAFMSTKWVMIWLWQLLTFILLKQHYEKAFKLVSFIIKKNWWEATKTNNYLTLLSDKPIKHLGLVSESSCGFLQAQIN